MNKQLAITILMLAILLGCASETSTKETTETIKIGVNFPMSGGLSVYGEPLLEGLQIAVEEVNANGGVNGKSFELIVEDNRGVPTDAVTAMQKLISQDVALVMSTMVGLTGAITPVAEQNKQVLLYAAAADTFAEDNTFVFKDSVDAFYDCELLGNFVAEQGAERVGLFGTDAEFTRKCEEGIKQKTNLSLDVAEYYVKDAKNTEVDYRTALTKLKAANVDAIFLSAYADDCLLIWKQINELGINKPFLIPFTQTGCGEDKASEFIGTGKEVIGLDFVVNKASPEFTKFITSFREKYNKEPSLLFFTALAYDWAHYVAEALENCPDATDSECVKKELEQIKHTGAWGDVEFTAKHTTKRPRQFIEFSDKSWKVLKQNQEQQKGE